MVGAPTTLEFRPKSGSPAPAETGKAMLLPGEIADLSRAVERLTGYRDLVYAFASREAELGPVHP